MVFICFYSDFLHILHGLTFARFVDSSISICSSVSEVREEFRRLVAFEGVGFTGEVGLLLLDS